MSAFKARPIQYSLLPAVLAVSLAVSNAPSAMAGDDQVAAQLARILGNADLPKNGEQKIWYGKVSLMGQEAGRARFQLTGKAGDGGAVYEFISAMEFKMPNGVQISGQVTASLKEMLEPVRIEMIRNVAAPDGSVLEKQHEVTVVGAESVDVTSTKGDDTHKTTAPRPTESFMFGFEGILPWSQPADLDGVTLQELNPQTGKVVSYTSKVDKQPSGKKTITVTRSDGGTIQEFNFDSGDKFVGFTGAGGAQRIEVSTKKAYDALKI